MSSQSPEGMESTFLRRWTAARPEPVRFSPAWWWVWTIRFIVFGITGSSSVYFVRPFMRDSLGIEGTLIEGPWSYRIGSFVFVTPIYTVILLSIGFASGQFAFFANVARRMWCRILPGIVAKPAKKA
ncbi:uncharacterized protein MONBRDRAFT_26200 [Monosiga brevicollis MX1]|uniref:DUF6787 domain-containing protein n=1 Tax=Monosiga brevicollis TaxID=81824 RepID=A9V1N0_MONBE|nr:uncharacterized protein MONBRDRAFT_26200 [Monosiga brevicollis MX1]EDQ88469.1 predicted protein [Monosiga brevicollis MX1]|eukprot:XP_001746573.1 hypothetical protein [Monosiga brevicollis MX1]